MSPAQLSLRCDWCDRPFLPRRSGGRAQRFCLAVCRRAHDAAARARGRAEIESERTTVAGVVGGPGQRARCYSGRKPRPRCSAKGPAIPRFLRRRRGLSLRSHLPRSKVSSSSAGSGPISATTCKQSWARCGASDGRRWLRASSETRVKQAIREISRRSRDRSRFGEETFAGTHGNGRDAPTAAIRGTAIELANRP